MLMFTLAISYLTTSNLPDNHDGVITHLEPGILEWEVKWALGSITTNKASGGDGIPVNGTPLQYSCLENPMDGGAW